MFLNPIIGGSYYVFWNYGDNVALIPAKIVMQNLLANGEFDDLELSVLDIEEITQVLDCFDFEYENSMSKNEYNDMIRTRSLDKNALEQKIIK